MHGRTEMIQLIVVIDKPSTLGSWINHACPPASTMTCDTGTPQYTHDEMTNF